MDNREDLTAFKERFDWDEVETILESESIFFGSTPTESAMGKTL